MNELPISAGSSDPRFENSVMIANYIQELEGLVRFEMNRANTAQCRLQMCESLLLQVIEERDDLKAKVMSLEEQLI